MSIAANGDDDAIAARQELRRVLDDLTAKANKGEPGALAALRRFLEEHPEIHETLGDLAKYAERAWLDLLTRGDALAQESVRKQLDNLKEALAGNHPTPMEKLLVDQIAVCRLAECQAEVAAADAGRHSLGQAVFNLKRAESTQRRYLNSIKMLALLRSQVPQGLFPNIHIFEPEKKKAKA
jgi:hypothetical protein